MSKGLGKWERALLDAVERDGYAYPAALADAISGTLAARQAALRAAKTLDQKNLVVYWVYRWGAGPRVLIVKPGAAHEKRPPVPPYQDLYSITAA